jgi:hypothetical protein
MGAEALAQRTPELQERQQVWIPEGSYNRLPQT